MRIRKGFTILELIIVLAVLGLAYMGVALLINRAMDNFNATRLLQNVGAIQIAMLQTFKAKGQYPAVDSKAETVELQDSLIQAGKLTEGEFIQPFGGIDGKLSVWSASFRGRKNAAFVIRVDRVEKDQCSTIVSLALNTFPYVEVVNSGVKKTEDLYAKKTGNTGMGVLKSPIPSSEPGAGEEIDLTNLDQLGRLCGAEDQYYDIYLGNY